MKEAKTSTEQTHGVARESFKSPYLTPQEACEYLRITRSTLYNLVWQQKIVPVKKGQGKKPRLLFKLSELKRFLGELNAD